MNRTALNRILFLLPIDQLLCSIYKCRIYHKGLPSRWPRATNPKIWDYLECRIFIEKVFGTNTIFYDTIRLYVYNFIHVCMCIYRIYVYVGYTNCMQLVRLRYYLHLNLLFALCVCLLEPEYRIVALIQAFRTTGSKLFRK